MIPARQALERILIGEDAMKAQGFLVCAPAGFGLRPLLREVLIAAYDTEAHPDLRILAPEGAGNLVTVDAVRDQQLFLASSPAGRGMKTLLVLEAHRMNAAAANALLKNLEEPSRHTRIILVTDQPGAILPTIRSRCARIHVTVDESLAIGETQARLEDGASKIAPDDAAIAAALVATDGNPSLAALVITHDLQGWMSNADAWLRSGSPTPPLPPLGKGAAPLALLAELLQLVALRQARQENGHPGAVAAAWSVMSAMGDIGRAGIDAKTRLHRMMSSARQARMVA